MKRSWKTNMTLKINPILCLKESMNNYAYVLTDNNQSFCAIIDASEAAPMLFVSEYVPA